MVQLVDAGGGGGVSAVVPGGEGVAVPAVPSGVGGENPLAFLRDHEMFQQIRWVANLHNTGR